MRRRQEEKNGHAETAKVLKNWRTRRRRMPASALAYLPCCFLSWLFAARKEKAGPGGGGVNGLHGHLVRAPVDAAGRTGSMSVNAERPRKAEKTAIEAWQLMQTIPRYRLYD